MGFVDGGQDAPLWMPQVSLAVARDYLTFRGDEVAYVRQGPIGEFLDDGAGDYGDAMGLREVFECSKAG